MLYICYKSNLLEVSPHNRIKMYNIFSLRIWIISTKKIKQEITDLEHGQHNKLESLCLIPAIFFFFSYNTRNQMSVFLLILL